MDCVVHGELGQSLKIFQIYKQSFSILKQFGPMTRMLPNLFLRKQTYEESQAIHFSRILDTVKPPEPLASAHR